MACASAARRDALPRFACDGFCYWLGFGRFKVGRSPAGGAAGAAAVGVAPVAGVAAEMLLSE